MYIFVAVLFFNISVKCNTMFQIQPQNNSLMDIQKIIFYSNAS